MLGFVAHALPQVVHTVLAATPVNTTECIKHPAQNSLLGTQQMMAMDETKGGLTRNRGRERSR